MDIHKPKPWHSFREFLKEYVIIVVGVATALVGESAVEALHWRHAAADAREAMKGTEQSLVRFTGERETQSSCLTAEFRRIRAVLDQAQATGALPVIASVRNPARRGWAFAVYDGVVSGGVLPHLPTAERTAVTGINAWSAYIQRNRDVEVRDWSVLRSLEGPGRKVGEAELANLRGALSEAIYQAGVIRGGAHNLAQRILDHGVLSRKEFNEAWTKGAQEGREGPYGACPSRTESDTDQQLRQLDIPVGPPPAPPAPPTWPKGAG
jgi:hypothetical protein